MRMLYKEVSNSDCYLNKVEQAHCESPAHGTGDELDMRSINSLDGYDFYIPSQQRGYRWTVKNIYELVEDLVDFRSSASPRYSLQPLAVIDTGTQYTVLDGQQRLTSICILMKALDIPCRYNLDFERDLNANKSRKELIEHLETLAKVDDETIDSFHITRAYLALESLFDESVEIKLNKEDSRTRTRLISKLNDSKNEITNHKWLTRLLAGEISSKRVEFIWYQVPESQAHKVFRNLNSGKIELSNSDLIKALLLSEQSVIPVEKRTIVAIQFENIQMAMKNDRLWHMLQWHEFQRNGYRMMIVDSKEKPGYIAVQNRIDLIFNLVAGVSFDVYQSDALISFRYYYDNREDLVEIWNRTYRYYLLIKGLYDNPLTYHYCGVLTFFNRNGSGSYKHIKNWLNWMQTKPKNMVVEQLKAAIRFSIRGRKGEDYELPVYKSSDLEPVRRILLLHNVETIIHLYLEKNKDRGLHLSAIYEVFPFDLLYRQFWDIEHVSSQSDNKMKNIRDCEVWATNFRNDYRRIFEAKLPKAHSDDKAADSETRILDFSISEIQEIRKLYDKYNVAGDSDKKEAFHSLYQYVITRMDEHLKEEKIVDKDYIGNLVLLDRHTNRSFHNALFPTKRRIVLEANGGLSETESKDDADSTKLSFIPLCTRQVFTKHYSTAPGMSLSAWTKTDFDNYLADIKLKLKYYIE